ncbi:MAG TPA: dihydrodipicolinate synthase family protein [Acidimicrobiales bacterium]|nr:dihydrodipicolinate synthase family protein [Acidimicrobiales bacterium]
MTSLGGVMPALITPLTGAGGVDRAGLDRLLDHVLSAPVAGLSPCGSTGEGPLLGRAVRMDTVRAAAAHLGPGQWLVPGVAAVNAGAAIEEIDAYAEAGASAVLVAPPWYYPVDSGEVVDFFSAVADRAALPVVLYNIPAMTKVVIPVDAVSQLAAHAKVIGIKDSSRDFEYFQAVVAATAAADFAVLTGTDTMLVASLQAGGAGTIAASVNVVPSLVQDLYELTRAGRLDQARPLQQRVTDVVSAARRAGFPRGWKAAVEALGLCDRTTAHPLRPLDDAGAKRLGDELRRLGVIEP